VVGDGGGAAAPPPPREGDTGGDRSGFQRPLLSAAALDADVRDRNLFPWKVFE
jgi:hypothetical protein